MDKKVGPRSRELAPGAQFQFKITELCIEGHFFPLAASSHLSPSSFSNLEWQRVSREASISRSRSFLPVRRWAEYKRRISYAIFFRTVEIGLYENHRKLIIVELITHFWPSPSIKSVMLWEVYCIQISCSGWPTGKVATDTNILDLRTRHRTKLGWFFWFWPIQRYNTKKGKWQILYLRTRYRSKLGWFFWFGLIHMTVRRNLDENQWPVCCRRPMTNERHLFVL